MKKTKSSDFSDRSNAAAEARLKLVEAHRSAREAAEPTRLLRQAERLAVAEARDQRRAERDQAKREFEDRLRTEAAEQHAALDAAAKEEADARKAERDRRYANRKARQRA